MNYGRGFPLPHYDNRKPWIPAMGIPLENEIGQNQGSWASAMLGGQISQGSEGVGETPRRVIARDDGILCGRGSELESWITRSTENGVVGNGIVQNSENWNRAIPTNLYSQGNGNGNGEVSSSWTPVTPGKLIPQKSNLVMSNKPWNQGENENWEDLVGIYQHVLQKETLNLNEVAQDNYQNNENQNRLASTANRNLNQIPSPNRNHGSKQASHSVPYFPSKDPANWDDSLLAAIVGPKKSSGSNLFIKRPLNNSLHDLNETPVQNSSTQIGYVLGTQQSPTVNSKKLQTDGFPVPYRPCYDLNSPSRSEHDAALSGITGPLPFAPITPDTQQKHIGGQWVPVKDRHETQRIKDVDNHYIGDSSSSAVPTTQKEHLVLEEEGELGIDLNKTPNQKTPARRKKHRPKVIIEGKPKRTRTPKDPKNKSANETRVKRKYVKRTPQGNGVEMTPKVERKYASGTPQGNGVEITSRVKRKYVRKKGVDQSNSQKKTQQEETAKPVVEAPAKSCKRQLKFDLESVERNESQTRSENQGINLNDNAQDREKERRINSILKRSAMKVAQNNMYAGVTAHQEMQPELNGQSMPMAKAQDHALNVLARNLLLRKSVPNQGNWINRCIQSGPVSTALEGNQRNGQRVNFDEARGIKRPFFEQINPRNLNAMDSIYMYQKLLLGGDNRVDRSSNDLTRIMQSHKKTKMQNYHSTPCSDDNSRGDSGRPNSVYGNTAALQLLYSCTERVNQSYQVNGHHFQTPMATATQNLQKPLGSSEMQPIMDRPQRLTQTQGRGVNSVTAMVNWNKPPATPPKDYPRSAVLTSPATLLNKNGTAMQYSSSQRSNEPDKMLLQLRRDTPKAHQISFMKPKGGPRKQKGVLSVENITCMLESLCIYDESEKERNALVPYRGNNNNAIIPFEPIKKRKPRAKVDLDPETDRLWRLLMGKEGSEAAETMDKDKEKWWEDERRVFRGRADSFIARMHLVQGDRRFSRWKGSVVDSVIGVFLTQNVSDHLSSSAFMSLAAKFTLKTTTTNTTRCEDGACVFVEEPIETILPTDKIGRQPVFNLSSFVSCESTEQLRYNIISSSNSAANKHDRASEEVILSQDSLDSSTIQTVDEIRSSSGSNSEAEDQTTGFETSQEPTPPNPTQAQKVSMFKELFSHDNRTTQINNRSQYMHHLPKTPVPIPIISGVNNVNTASRFTPPNSSEFEINMTTGSQNVGSCDFRLLGGESISSLPSSNKSGMTGRYPTSNVTYQQNETARFQELPQGRQYNFLSNHPQPHNGSVNDINGNHQPSTKAENIVQKQDSCSEDRVSTVDKENCVQNVSAEANSKEQNYSSRDPLNRPDKSTLKGGKGTGEDEKNGFDWDSLRRDVLLKSEKRERSKDARDSLDYEALRRAHVNEISDAIRERGMNNLLADRIKAFLDRLVRDHGSIDLEWLRDVPPDKAKDYLLSIRGLGLKSVECVRLLTLHHLAFPVDTNVGRIAVRLGWVPLQPLPESLQLHLLEMYPVLESIQKYLWPRLCKLDQLTLYELHYQMITFGKVFCTKSKPNCNACPMRAECRHFSSAFASARLALPGPEEKRIVPSDASNAQNSTHTTPPVISRPMPLPPAENNCNNNTQFFNEPIIEEPTTPEPEAAELAISDIEDQYYDDADEIPTIKLDMNEFTANLQKMQNSTDIQGDMSKALVALNPQAASIPTPKLKNVSRLRTEHLVYELPDSHPLLEGLYKREPDDPSPYLLAIWTPGETAHSMQPPERGCQAQESGMLCDRTTCFSCNCIKEANSQVVRGTILMPCRTATRGSFPLNGTYFQVNEMFADHASSLNPIDVPRAWIWNLPRRTVYFGTSVSTIFKGLTTQEIQQCFWRGFVCVRGFDQKMRAPRPLMARLHFPASKLVKTKNEDK